MSWWTHICGVVRVSPPGRTQHEADYIVKTILDHLPVVTGSERDMEVFVNVNPNHNSSSSCDEFGMITNNLRDRYGDRSLNRGWLEMSDDYYLTVYGDFRDRHFNQTFRELQKWLCRLSKRINVGDVNITISADDREEPYHLIIDNYWKSKNPYRDMYEWPSWVEDSDGEPAWWEYLMWETDMYSGLPVQLLYKYCEDKDVDGEMEHRENWMDMRRQALHNARVKAEEERRRKNGD